MPGPSVFPSGEPGVSGVETKSRLVSPGARRREKWGMTGNGYRASLWKDKNVLKVDIGDIQLCEHIKPPNYTLEKDKL